MKRPAFQFYPADWRKDMALQSCSVAARGLWVDMLCIAHECEPYGHLTVNGKPMTPAQIGRHTGLTERECSKLVAELEEAGVLSRADDGAIFSRRMVRDEEIRQSRAEGGKAGSEHGAKGAEHGKKGGRPRKETGDKKPPLEPPPSSSSSASAVTPSVPDGTGASPPSPPAEVQAKPLTAKERVWLLGVPLLGDTAASRSLLGKLSKTYGEDALARVLAEATADPPAEPKAWLVAACEAAKTRTNGHHQPDMLDNPTPDWALRAGFENRFLAESAGCGPGNFHKFAAGRRVTQ